MKKFYTFQFKVTLLKSLALVLILLLLSFGSLAQRKLVHPGLSHTQADLDRMKYLVEAGVEPWFSAFKEMASESRASYNYNVGGNQGMTFVDTEASSGRAFMSDARAAYLNALMWSITGDERHARKAVEIFNAWQNITTVAGGGTESLAAGLIIYLMLEGAEIIKSTYDGWTPDDIAKFGEMLVYPGYSTEGRPASVNNNYGSFYWRVYNGDPGRHGNQDLFGWRAVMAMGVFLDNEVMYERGMRYFMGLPAREDDIPYQSGPPVTSAEPISTNQYFDTYRQQGYSNEIPDYGYNGVLEYFIWENGQSQESSRDQDHTILGVGLCASMAQILWNQRDDAWGHLENRLLLGYGFSLKYNMSYVYTFPGQLEPWNPTVESGEFIQRRDRSGRWFSKSMNPHYESNFTNISRGNFKSDKRPVFEKAYAHYAIRLGIENEDVRWIYRAREISNIEMGWERDGWSNDHKGRGTLTARRPDHCPGDPVKGFEDGVPLFGMHVLPGTIDAVNFDVFTGDGEGRTYHDKTTQISGAAYRSDARVDIDGNEQDGFYLTSMEEGEWLSYTVYIPVSSYYDLEVNYSAKDASGKIQFTLDLEDVTGEVALPFGDDFSNGIDDWKDFKVASGVYIEKGVRSLRLHVAASSETYQIRNISIRLVGDGEEEVQLSASHQGKVFLKWELQNVFPGRANIYRHGVDDFPQSTLIAEGLIGNAYVDEQVEHGQTYYYWVEHFDTKGASFISNVVSISPEFGLINDHFEDSDDGWVAVNPESLIAVSDGHLVVSLLDQADGTKAAGISRLGGALMHGGHYPILAVKMNAPETFDLFLDAQWGTYGRAANQYTGKIGDDVFYYDLTQVGFGVLQRRLSATTTTTLTRLLFRLENIESDDAEFSVDWVQTFSSVEALEAYLGVTSTNPIPEEPFNVRYYYRDGMINVLDLPQNARLQLYDMVGRLLISRETNGGSGTLSVKKNGFYIIRVITPEGQRSIKVAAF